MKVIPDFHFYFFESGVQLRSRTLPMGPLSGVWGLVCPAWPYLVNGAPHSLLLVVLLVKLNFCKNSPQDPNFGPNLFVLCSRGIIQCI